MGQLSMNVYLKQLKKSYQKAKKLEKATILDEFCETSGYHRKHAIRLFNQPINKKKKINKTDRKPTYKETMVLESLKKIWIQSNPLCGRGLKVVLPLWLPDYEYAYGCLNEENLHLLLSMSSAILMQRVP